MEEKKNRELSMEELDKVSGGNIGEPGTFDPLSWESSKSKEPEISVFIEPKSSVNSDPNTLPPASDIIGAFKPSGLVDLDPGIEAVSFGPGTESFTPVPGFGPQG